MQSELASGALSAALLTLCLLLTNACAQHLNTPDRNSEVPETLTPESVKVREDVPFSPAGWPQELRADLYQPERRPGTSGPAMVMVHGGGWEGRSRGDMNRQARRFAEAGYTVMNIDYRFAPEFPFPAAVEDVQIALRWLREQAPDLDVDAEQTGLLGFSSGAHLASLVALVAGTDSVLDRPWGGSEIRPVGVVVGGTPTDLRKFEEGRLVEQFLGGTLAQVPERYELASPVVHVHPEAPPFFHFHGAWDRLVPPDHSADFHAELMDAGVHSELFRMRLRGHATSLVFSGDATRAGIDFMNRKISGDR